MLRRIITQNRIWNIIYNYIMLEFKNYNKNKKWCAYTKVRIIHNNNKKDKNVFASEHETQNM